MRAEEVIKLLQLEPLSVEGGFYNEIYRSKLFAEVDGKPRCCGTGIYYLMTRKDISAWHKVNADEIWVYHGGSPAVQFLVFPDGSPEKRIIGCDLKNGQQPQSVIPAGVWQAAILLDRGADAWGLFGAMVFPGFEYEDFTGAAVAEMIEKFPHLKKEISSFFP
ncbi:MAG: cupin domain-containing protein [Victivallaceae bacterium]|nr:cupin domain-containing protein [Victivallaceae bacterium]